MGSHDEEEQPFPSTTFAWRRVKIRTAPQAQAQRGRRPHRWFGCYPWPRSQKLTIVVTDRGGAEAWFLIEARGRRGVFPGHRQLVDVMTELYQS